MKVLSKEQLESFKLDIISGTSLKELGFKYNIRQKSVSKIYKRLGFTVEQVIFFRRHRQAPDKKICNKCGESKPLNELCRSKRKLSTDKTTPLCKKCYNEREQKRINKNLPYFQKYRKEYARKNRARRNRLQRDRLNNNPILKIKSYLSTRISEVLHGKNGKKTINFIGCSLDFLRLYLESKWVEGMCWDNYGHGKDKWHVDHIKPISKFDLSKDSEINICFHYTNLQPLWQIDNLKKHNKFIA